MSFAKLFDRVDKLVSVLPLPIPRKGVETMIHRILRGRYITFHLLIPRKGIKIIIIDELPLCFPIESILGKVANV